MAADVVGRLDLPQFAVLMPFSALELFDQPHSRALSINGFPRY